MHYRDLLKTIWNSLYEPGCDTAKIIENYFHPAYEQCINGIYLKRDEYINHVIEQKRNMVIESIDYSHVIEKNSELFALYVVKGTNKNNLPIEAEVIAYFLFDKQQVIKIHGQVR